jgi:hypothetical protein
MRFKNTSSISGISLSGKSVIATGSTSISLAGKTSVGAVSEDPRIKEVRTLIIERFLMPLMRRDTKEVYHNFYLLPRIKSTIEALKERNPDMEYYHDIVSFLEDSFNVYKTVNTLYENNPENKSGFGNFMVRTATITLKPQYHLYNLIIGKPPKGEQYKKEIIEYILVLLSRINLKYDEIYTLVRRRFGYPEVPLS